METPVKRGRGRPKVPQLPVVAHRWEYITLNNERPLSKADYDALGADGWELVTVYVRLDAVHAIFKREVVWVTT